MLQRIGNLRGLAARGVSEVRSAVYSLSSLHVRSSGLLPSLRALANEFSHSTGVSAEVRIDGSLPSLSDEVESGVYRMVHEALVNVDRHARATGVVITLNPTGRQLEISIRDDGVGLDQRQGAHWRSAAHFGMRMMAKAIEECGGEFSASPHNPRGLLIRAAVPVRPRRGGL